MSAPTPPLSPPGRVYLAGAGPGDPGLCTVRTRELITRADVLVYDYLCNPELLAWARPEAERIYVGKSGARHTFTQEEINALLVARARAGQCVVRLKGGDPYVFGRGGEEAQELLAAGIAFEEVPGVSSAIAAPAYAGIPVTHRDFASQVTFITGHEDPTKPDSSLDWKNLAEARGTKVFLMGIDRLRALTQNLLREGADPATPVALIRWGTTPRQATLTGTLATIADLAEQANFRPPAITIIGEVVRLGAHLDWFTRRPLFGQRIVVTRSLAQVGRLSERLREQGADVLEIPTIRIVPRALEPASQSALADLSTRADWLVFTSPNGVDRFFEEFEAAVPDRRQLGPLRFAAIGAATAQKIRDRHLAVELQPATFDQEHLAQAFTRERTAGHRFLLVQGNRARSVLADHLAERGGRVEVWTLYETEPETRDPSGARARYEAEGAHWIVFTSSSTAENWAQLRLEPPSGGPRPRALSMGPVTSATLRELNWPVAAESPQSTLDSLIATLLDLCQP